MSEKNVLRGKTPAHPVSQENLGAFLYKFLVTRNRNETVFINDESGETLTYGELLENSCRLAHSFCAYGVLTNDKVIAICSDNHINYFTVVLAALYVGVPIGFINPTYTEHELQHAINLLKPDMVFCSSPYLKKFIKLRSQNQFVRNIVTIDSDKSTDSYSFKKFINQYSDKELTFMGFSTRELDVKNHTAFILFSSGTTGLPKGVMLSHLGVNATFASILDPTVDPPHVNALVNPITLAVLPFFHIYGLHVVMVDLYRGRKILVLEKFLPELYLKNVQKYKIYRLITVPPLIQFLLKSETVNKYDLSSVKEITCGAAPLGKSSVEAIKKKFNVDLVRQGYGMTESGLVITLPPFDIERPGSVGRAFPGVSCTVKNTDTGENLGPNQSGEICVKGQLIMKGYYGDEEATRNAFTEDGWLKTGDIGYYDEEGFFYIIDRIKELIKYKGFQVAPAELEQILLNNPKIQDAGVVGVPDDDAGELAVAYIVKQPNVSLTEEEVHRYLADFVSRNKYLYGGVKFVDAIPRSLSGKILRKELRRIAANMKSKL